MGAHRYLKRCAASAILAGHPLEGARAVNSEDTGMIRKNTTALAAIAAGLAAVASTSAFAGSCPAGKMVGGAEHGKMTMPKGVTDKVIASIDLVEEKVGLKDH